MLSEYLYWQDKDNLLFKEIHLLVRQKSSFIPEVVTQDRQHRVPDAQIFRACDSQGINS